MTQICRQWARQRTGRQPAPSGLSRPLEGQGWTPRGAQTPARLSEAASSNPTPYQERTVSHRMRMNLRWYRVARRRRRVRSVTTLELAGAQAYQDPIPWHPRLPRKNLPGSFLEQQPKTNGLQRLSRPHYLGPANGSNMLRTMLRLWRCRQLEYCNNPPSTFPPPSFTHCPWGQYQAGQLRPLQDRRGRKLLATQAWASSRENPLLRTSCHPATRQVLTLTRLNHSGS